MRGDESRPPIQPAYILPLSHQSHVCREADKIYLCMWNCSYYILFTALQGSVPVHGLAECRDWGAATAEHQHIQPTAQRDVTQLPAEQDLPQTWVVTKWKRLSLATQRISHSNAGCTVYHLRYLDDGCTLKRRLRRIASMALWPQITWTPCITGGELIIYTVSFNIVIELPFPPCERYMLFRSTYPFLNIFRSTLN
jgi:hypothetical protein